MDDCVILDIVGLLCIYDMLLMLNGDLFFVDVQDCWIFYCLLLGFVVEIICVFDSVDVINDISMVWLFDMILLLGYVEGDD